MNQPQIWMDQTQRVWQQLYFGLSIFIIPSHIYFSGVLALIFTESSSLSRIMEDRKGQENFQLIVITHDERFAQLIGQRQHAERYYRVTKDDQ